MPGNPEDMPVRPNPLDKAGKKAYKKRKKWIGPGAGSPERSHMEQEDIVRDIAGRTHLSVEDADRTVQIFFDVMFDELKKDRQNFSAEND